MENGNDMVTNREIVAALHEYYETRDKLKDCRANLVRIAVECGACQQDALKANVSDYLDGYLAGAGLLPAARKEAA